MEDSVNHPIRAEINAVNEGSQESGRVVLHELTGRVFFERRDTGSRSVKRCAQKGTPFCEVRKNPYSLYTYVEYNTSSKRNSDTGSSSSSRSGRSPSRPSKKSDPSSTERDSLQEIAEDLIGDEDLQVTADDESVRSKARKRAKKQGRDPAVDPKYNQP